MNKKVVSLETSSLFENNTIYMLSAILFTALIVFQEPETLQPSIAISVSDTDSLFHPNAAEISVILDRIKVATTTSFVDAVSCLIMVHWIYNVEFCDSVSRTLSFMAGHVCGLQTLKITKVIQHGLNVLYA